MVNWYHSLDWYERRVLKLKLALCGLAFLVSGVGAFVIR